MKTTPEPKAKVIFRVWPKSEGGQVLALFPREASTVGHPEFCTSYAHVGQHSGADIAGLTFKLRLATRAEYADLARELRGLGYRLDIRSRSGRADYDKRKRQLEL